MIGLSLARNEERKVYKAGVGISEGSILLLCSSERAITVYYDVIHDAGRDNNRRMAFEALERCSVRLGTGEGEGRGANPFGLAKDSLSALFIRIIWPLDNLWPCNLSTDALAHVLVLCLFLSALDNSFSPPFPFSTRGIFIRSIAIEDIGWMNFTLELIIFPVEGINTVQYCPLINWRQITRRCKTIGASTLKVFDREFVLVATPLLIDYRSPAESA